MGSLFEQAASILERRFLKNAFLPVLVFFPAVLAPTLIQGHRLSTLIRLWDRQAGTLKLMEAIGYFTFVWFVAAIVASQWRNIIRLYEGYPFARWPWLENFGKTWHKAERTRIVNSPQDPATLFLEYWAYPTTPDDVLPTRLGNVLHAAETYALDRYQAETISLWPRLHHVVPRETLADIEDARATLEFLLVLSLWFLGFGIGNILLMVGFRSSGPVAVVLFAGGLLASYLSYISAIHAAVEYGAYIRATFEVYRFELLTRLRIPPPANLLEERQRWSELYELIIARKLPPGPYDTGASEVQVRLTDLQSTHGGVGS